MNQQIDARQAQNYANGVLKRLETKPESLTEHERRLAVKYQQANALSGKLNKDVEAMRSQIRQAEARLRSLELQAAEAQGKANNLIEVLISFKFEDEPQIPNRPAGPDPDNKGNGNGKPPGKARRKSAAPKKAAQQKQAQA